MHHLRHLPQTVVNVCQPTKRLALVASLLAWLGFAAAQEIVDFEFTPVPAARPVDVECYHQVAHFTPALETITEFSMVEGRMYFSLWRFSESASVLALGPDYDPQRGHGLYLSRGGEPLASEQIRLGSFELLPSNGWFLEKLTVQLSPSQIDTLTRSKVPVTYRVEARESQQGTLPVAQLRPAADFVERCYRVLDAE